LDWWWGAPEKGGLQQGSGHGKEKSDIDVNTRRERERMAAVGADESIWTREAAEYSSTPSAR
jgi:hypothetical protein